MMMTARRSLIALALCAAPAFAAAPADTVATNPAAAMITVPGVAQRADVTLELANQLLNATMAACHAQGLTGVAAVVDRGGNLVALQRDDNVGPHNTLAAQRKAFTSLSTKTASRELSERARNNPEAENLNTVGELLLLGGGVPLKVGDQVIGAIGVAGAGGAAIDEGCALAGIAKVLPKAS